MDEIQNNVRRHCFNLIEKGAAKSIHLISSHISVSSPKICFDTSQFNDVMVIVLLASWVIFSLTAIGKYSDDGLE